MSTPAASGSRSRSAVKNSGSTRSSFSRTTLRSTARRSAAGSPSCSARPACTAVASARRRRTLRTSPTNSAPPGASSRRARSTTSWRYPAFGKYCATELSTIVSKYPAGRPSSSCAAWVRSSTRPASSLSAATCRRSSSIAEAEKSVPQYASQSGASCDRSRPVPTPSSSTRRGRRARMRSTVRARHSRICSSGMGCPS